MRLSLLLPSLLLVLCCARAEAAKIKVPGDHATIQAAVNAASAGDVIEISQGTYAENVLIDDELDLTIRAKGGHKVTIDAAGLAPTAALKIRNSSTNVLVKGLTVVNSIAEGIAVQSSQNITIANCKLKNSGTDGIGVLDSTGVLIDKCSIDGAGDQGIEVDGEGCRVRKSHVRDAIVGIRVTGEGNTIEDSSIEKTFSHGIRLGNGGSGCTLSLVMNNKVESTDDYAFYCSPDADYCSILDNDVRDSYGGLLVTTASSAHFVAGNTFEKLDQRGISYAGSLCTLEKNVVVQSGYQGIRLSDLSGVAFLHKNIVKKSSEDGLYVQSSGHVIMENKVSGSGGYDLNDLTAPGSNLYVANTFGTIAP